MWCELFVFGVDECDKEDCKLGFSIKELKKKLKKDYTSNVFIKFLFPL